jgi:hypothetical protein
VDTITVHRPTFGADRYGDTATVTAWTDHTVDRCRLAFTGSSDRTDTGRDGSFTTATLYAPPGADIAARDEITVRGKRYQIDGEPGEWRPVAGTLPGGTEVRLRRAVG